MASLTTASKTLPTGSLPPNLVDSAIPNAAMGNGVPSCSTNRHGTYNATVVNPELRLLVAAVSGSCAFSSSNHSATAVSNSAFRWPAVNWYGAIRLLEYTPTFADAMLALNTQSIVLVLLFDEHCNMT